VPAELHTEQGNMKMLQKRRKLPAVSKQQLCTSMLSAGFEREILPNNAAADLRLTPHGLQLRLIRQYKYHFVHIRTEKIVGLCCDQLPEIALSNCPSLTVKSRPFQLRIEMDKLLMGRLLLHAK